MKSTNWVTYLATIALGVGAAGCGSSQPEPGPPAAQQIVVNGMDYAFGMAETVEAGPAEIRFQNTGEVDHEMVLVRLQEGATMDDVSEAMGSGEDPRQFIDGIVGILIAGPGEAGLGALNVEFAPGRTYLMVCNFTDTPDAPPHLELGMVSAFTVPEAASSQ